MPNTCPSHCYLPILIMTLITSFTAIGLVFLLVITSSLMSSSAFAAHGEDPPLETGTVIYQHQDTGVALEVDFFQGGVIRLRARTSPNAFQVTDVVVAKKLSPGPTKLTTPPPSSSNDPIPAGKFSCGKDSADESRTMCMVTTPCGVATLKVLHVKDRDYEWAYFNNKLKKIVLQGKFEARGDNNGPVGEISFPEAAAVYGIPERAIDLALKAGHSYRLWNLDVFKYQLEDTKGIYGTIPFLLGHSVKGEDVSSSVGALWLNAADTTVEVARLQQQGGEGGDPATAGWHTKWTSEFGMPDIFMFPGTTPHQVQKQHAHVVGPSLMPPIFSLGYHQCRWNYRSEDDALAVDHGFETHDIPYDVLWLDIEHTDGKRYFTWDNANFPNPKQMIDQIASRGRKMVTITDPHIKRDENYHVHKEATAKRFYVMNSEGNADFEGHCWPGQSSWVDFFNKEARKWYATLFHYDRYPGSTPDLYSWIDMNEPSVFNAHEVTMDKKALHHTAGGVKVQHGVLHNMYGYYHTMAAFDGHLLRNSIAPYVLKRPFILTRSFFSGSQRYAAMWTGDNMARWDHLQKSIPMLLALSLSNYIFVGADVGGFFDNPDAQLMTRWYQTAVFYPFFRGHAHLETKRREPWLFGDETTARIRNAITLRYSFLAYYYTQFFLAHDEGTLVMRPMFFEFPHDETMLQEQRSFMVGPGLLACPVIDENAATQNVVLPSSETWYEYPSGKLATSGSIPVTMDSIPTYIRAGHIVPIRQRIRRSAQAMINDPLTLVVGVKNSKSSKSTSSKGVFYHDDGSTYDYQTGNFLLQEFEFDATTKTLKSSPISKTPGQGVVASKEFAAKNTHLLVEKVVLFGLENADKIKSCTNNNNGGEVEVEMLDATTLMIKRPQLPIGESWSVQLE